MQTQQTYNLDLSKRVDLAILASPLYVSFGTEYRKEKFEVVEGEKNSWYRDERPIYGSSSDKTLLDLGYDSGSNGFVGFSPDDASKNSQSSKAVYLDLETNVSKDVLLGTAVRYEKYENFEASVNGKISSRWQIAAPFAVRGSVNTGFRVPTPGQSNLRSTVTAFTATGLEDSAVLPASHEISLANGSKPLKAEKSTGLGAGVIFKLGAADITMDYYRIEVKDRISLRPSKPLAPGDEGSDLFSGVQYFTNAFDSTTKGLDIVANYPIYWSYGKTLFSFIGNWTDTSVDKVNKVEVENEMVDIIDDVRIKRIEENLPEIRFSMEANHTKGPWKYLVRGQYYSGFYEAHAG